jgi:hypothetical protein
VGAQAYLETDRLPHTEKRCRAALRAGASWRKVSAVDP